MTKRILIDLSNDTVRTALTEDGNLVELRIDRLTGGSMVGQILLGTVKNILPSQFAFIDIGQTKNAFMNVEAGRALKTGQPLLIQVYKDASGTKGANVGEKLHLNGRLVILTDDLPEVGVSQKITDSAERTRLRGIARRAAVPGHGLIIRTNAQGKSEDDIRADITRLADLRRDITERARHARPPVVLYRENQLINDLLADDIDEIILNDASEHAAIRQTVYAAAPGFNGQVALHNETDGLPLFSAYGIEKQIERALRRQVWLPCGGFVTFEQTEACVVADVNTGKFTGRKDHRETVLRTNTEAAVCVAEQIRLRNLSGMIIVDFIDLCAEEDKRELVRVLGEAIKKDRIKTDIVGMTELGLVQLTRRKTREPLSRLLERDCPHCGGTGRVRL